MAIETFTPSPGPSPGTPVTFELKLKEATFGDGYSQNTRDGTNHVRKVAVLKWTALTSDQRVALETFFVTKGGDIPFLYTLTGDTERQWLAKTFSGSIDAPHTFTATLREDFNIYEE